MAPACPPIDTQESCSVRTSPQLCQAKHELQQANICVSRRMAHRAVWVLCVSCRQPSKGKRVCSVESRAQGPGSVPSPGLLCEVEVSDWTCVHRGSLSIDLLDKNSAECQGEVTKAPWRGSRAQCETSGSTAEDDLKELKGQPRRSGARATRVSALGGRAPYAPLGVELRRRVRLCGHSPCVLQP